MLLANIPVSQFPESADGQPHRHQLLRLVAPSVHRVPGRHRADVLPRGLHRGGRPHPLLHPVLLSLDGRGGL